MTITLDEKHERIVHQALGTGRFRSVEEVVAHALEEWERQERFGSPEERRRAVERMKAFHQEHPVTLGDTTIKELLHEGHKY